MLQEHFGLGFPNEWGNCLSPGPFGFQRQDQTLPLRIRGLNFLVCIGSRVEQHIGIGHLQITGIRYFHPLLRVKCQVLLGEWLHPILEVQVNVLMNDRLPGCKK